MNSKFRSTQPLMGVVTGTALLSLTLGLFGILATWPLSPLVKEFCPACSEIGLVTALCFIFSGLGLFFARKSNWSRLTGFFGITVMVLCTIALLASLTIKIFRFSSEPFFLFTLLMPPNNILAFVLSGSALIIAMKMQKKMISPLFVGLLASMIVALASVAIFGYITDIKPAYDWGEFQSMPLISAFGLLLLGIGIFAFAWFADRTPRATIRRWVPIVIGIGFMAVSIYLWQALASREISQIRRTVHAEARSVENEILSRMQSQIHSIERMAYRWSAMGQVRKAIWEKDIKFYIRHYPGLQAVEWINPTRQVRWIEPYRGNEHLQSHDLGQDDRMGPILLLAKKRNRSYVTEFFDLKRGGKGFQIFAPIIYQGEFYGFIGGIFRVEKLLDNILQNLALNYSISLYDGKTEIYNRNNSSNVLFDQWGEEIHIQFRSANWHVQIWPSQELLSEMRSPLPKVVLLVGIMMAGLLALSAYLAQTSRLRARELELTNVELQREISERKKAEEEIREMSVALENALDGISRLDINSLYVSVNKSFASMLGFQTDELLGKDLESTFSSASHKRLLTADRKMMTTGKSEVEVKAIRKDGTHFDAQLEFIKAYDKLHQFAGFYCFMQDITERKYRESLEIKSEFISMVSHELRTPLQAIKEGIGIVTDGTAGKLNNDQKNFLDIAKRNLERLARLIHDVLDFQKLEAGALEYEKELVNLNDTLKHVSDAMTPLAQTKGLDLQLFLDPLLPLVEVDPDRTTQVLMNLINNAIKFTDQGQITLASSTIDNSVQIAITDTGIGIRERDIPKLFKTFSQISTGKSKKIYGTGLGLAISKKIVEQHSGKIWVHSSYGEGSTFYFQIPLPVTVSLSP